MLAAPWGMYHKRSLEVGAACRRSLSLMKFRETFSRTAYCRSSSTTLKLLKFGMREVKSEAGLNHQSF